MKRLAQAFTAMLVMAVVAGLVAAQQGADTTLKAKGKVKTIDNEKQQFTITNSETNRDMDFYVATKNLQVSIGDQRSEFRNLKQGDEVTVYYTKGSPDAPAGAPRDAWIASKIEAKRSGGR